ncbi:type II secretion system protein GspD [Comamonas sp. NoAH]|uniref:type II secretion system protein GspD n=1 Tax=Comamonas halotolerans TaxID=3041496 RepID=UPI0024E165D2|nr:type II secretory pathway protein [Comamonas sp. NoAH]
MKSVRSYAVAACLAMHLVLGLLQPAYAAPVASFDMRAANVAEVLQLIYGEALNTPYVLDPEVLADERLVSFRYKNGQGNLQAFLGGFLESLGYVVERKGGVDFVRKRKVEEAPPPETRLHLYRPHYRDVSYLARVLAPLFKGSFSVNRSVRATGHSMPEGDVPSGSAAALIDQDADVLLFSGTEPEIRKLQELLPQVDVATGEVLVRGVVYEVSNTDKSGSAFGLLANLLSGKLNLGIGTAVGNMGNFIQLKNTALDAMYSMLETDSRFKIVSSPSLRIQSGSRGVFSVGQEVPVLGALSFPQGAGQAVQSVEYRSSGVIFDIRPTVRDTVIELEISQQISDFIKTTTGVDNSPTLTKRELQTTVGLQDGDVIVLGGLAENKSSRSRDGLSFMPSFLHTKGYEKSGTEILLVLQVERTGSGLSNTMNGHE